MFYFQFYKHPLEFLTPGFFKFIIFKPCFTIALFNPINGTTSQIVPSDTRSKKLIKSGSDFFVNQLDFLKS